MKIYISHRKDWEKVNSPEISLLIKDQEFLGVKSFKDGFLMFDNGPEPWLESKLLQIDPELDITFESR